MAVDKYGYVPEEHRERPGRYKIVYDVDGLFPYDQYATYVLIDTQTWHLIDSSDTYDSLRREVDRLDSLASE